MGAVTSAVTDTAFETEIEKSKAPGDMKET